MRHYGTAPGRFALYDDDGGTFDFEDGEYSWTELVVERGRDGRMQGRATRPARGRPFGYSAITWRMMTER